MIVGYRDKRTERFASGHHVREFAGFAGQAVIRLDRLDAASKLADLAALPGNRLAALKGERSRAGPAGRLRDKFGARSSMSRRVKKPLRPAGDRPKGARPYRGSQAERPQAYRPGGKPARAAAPRAPKPGPFVPEPEKIVVEA